MTIQGSGVSTTILRATGSALTTFNLPFPAEVATFSDLAVETNSSQLGARGVASSNSLSFTKAAVNCLAASCTAVEVTNSYVYGDEAKFTASGADSIGVSVTSPSNSNSFFEETLFSGFSTAIMGSDASVSLQSSIIDLGSRVDAVAIEQTVEFASSARLIRLAGSTIIGEGADQAGLLMTNESAQPVTATVGSSAIDLIGGGALPFSCDGVGVGNQALVAIGSGFDFDASSNCDETVTGGVDILAQSSGYVDRASRNLRLRFDSPLRDSGEVYAVKVLTYDDDDFYGLTRIRGANFDIGAAEYQNMAPSVSGDITYSRSGFNENVLALSVVASDEDDEPLSYAWSIDGGPIGSSGPSVTAAVDRVRFGSSASFAVVVTDPTGLSDTETRSITVNRLPYLDLRVALVTPKKPVAKLAATLRFVGKQPKGPRVLVTSNQAAKVRLVFTRKQTGRLMANRKCSTSKKLKRGKRCVVQRVLSKPILESNLVQGENWISLGGRVAGKKLAPGEYEVTAAGDTGEDTDLVKFGFAIRK